MDSGDNFSKKRRGIAGFPFNLGVLLLQSLESFVETEIRRIEERASHIFHKNRSTRGRGWGSLRLRKPFGRNNSRARPTGSLLLYPSSVHHVLDLKADDADLVVHRTVDFDRLASGFVPRSNATFAVSASGLSAGDFVQHGIPLKG